MIDTVTPSNQWEFNKEVVDCFDDMLSRSIPGYTTMRKLCFELGSRSLNEDSLIVDLGCSSGGSLLDFAKTYGDKMQYDGIEISEPMRDKAISNMAPYTSNANISNIDLRYGLPSYSQSPALILSILTIQFIPIEYRQRIIQSIYDSLPIGGIFIFVEKVLGSNSDMNELMTEVYYDMKRLHGYSNEQIERKRLSLEGVLVPITSAWNEQLLKDAGFGHVECFWRNLQFAGWIAKK